MSLAKNNFCNWKTWCKCCIMTCVTRCVVSFSWKSLLFAERYRRMMYKLAIRKPSERHFFQSDHMFWQLCNAANNLTCAYSIQAMVCLDIGLLLMTIQWQSAEKALKVFWSYRDIIVSLILFWPPKLKPLTANSPFCVLWNVLYKELCFTVK